MAKGWATWVSFTRPLEPRSGICKEVPICKEEFPEHCGALLSVLPMYSLSSSSRGTFTIPTASMRQPRLREAKSLSPGHPAWVEEQALTPGLCPNQDSQSNQSVQVAWAAGTEPTLCHLVPHSWQSLLHVTLLGGVCPRHLHRGDAAYRCASRRFLMLPPPRSHCS